MLAEELLGSVLLRFHSAGVTADTTESCRKLDFSASSMRRPASVNGELRFLPSFFGHLVADQREARGTRSLTAPRCASIATTDAPPNAFSS